MKVCFVSVDVEKREEQSDNPFEGVEKLDGFLNIFKKHKVNATLFVTGEVLEHYPDLTKNWSKDFEIGCHNYQHITLDKLDFRERERQIRDFIDLYSDIFGQYPKGFRAPRNIVDNEQFSILRRYGFLYDSSVLPRYPWPIRRYEGYRGWAPISPYWPDKNNYRRKSLSAALGASNKLLEIPESPAFFIVPFSGTWLRKLGIGTFKAMFRFIKPKFISFSMHSWEGVAFPGGKNSGEKFCNLYIRLL